MNNFFAALYNPDFEFNMICLFKLLKQTGEIYISLHSTTITWCISSLKPKLLRPTGFTPSILLYPFHQMSRISIDLFSIGIHTVR